MTLRQAPARKVIVVMAVLVTFAVTGIVLTAAWMGALEIAITASEQLKITDVQFSEGFLTVTVNNTGNTYALDIVIVTEVTVQPEPDLHNLNRTDTLYEVPMSIPVHKGEIASISIGYDWVSGEAYQIRVTTSRGNYCLFRYAVAP
jgi:hypothetical protein